MVVSPMLVRAVLLRWRRRLLLAMVVIIAVVPVVVVTVALVLSVAAMAVIVVVVVRARRRSRPRCAGGLGCRRVGGGRRDRCHRRCFRCGARGGGRCWGVSRSVSLGFLGFLRLLRLGWHWRDRRSRSWRRGIGRRGARRHSGPCRAFRARSCPPTLHLSLWSAL